MEWFEPERRQQQWQNRDDEGNGRQAFADGPDPDRDAVLIGQQAIASLIGPADLDEVVET